MALGRTAKYYRKNPKAKAKKAAYDKTFDASPARKKRRAELNKIRREARKKGMKIKGKDYDHATGKFISPKVNRGRRGEGNR